VSSERFRRVFGGYDRDQVDAALEARDERLERLEREAKLLAERLSEKERKLHEALAGDGGLGEASPGAIGALSRRLEEIHGQARRQATRIRMKALQDAVQMSDRVTELARLRDELGIRVQELAEIAGIRPGDEERPALGTEPALAATGEGIYAGDVELEVGPLGDFSQLARFEDAAASIEGASGITVRRFSGGRATLALHLSRPVELLRELERRAPFQFRVRDARGDAVVLEVESDSGTGRKAA
jgi:DivIVA domain-containing protein